MTNFIISHCLDYNSPRIRALRRFEINYTNQIAITPYPIVSPLLEELPGYLGFIGAANIESREKSSRADPSIPFILPAIFKVKDNNGNYSVTNIYYPSIVLAIVIKELHADISDVLAGNHELIIKNALYNGRRIDFKIPVDENYNMNINYKSGPGTSYIKIIPFEKIATTTLPPDCILFVGMYSRKGSRDLYQSPFGEMYGVEHLCYAIGTILSRDFLYEVPDWVNLAFILLLTLSVGLLTARGLRITIGAGAPLAILLPVAAGSVLFQFNIIIATLIPIMSGILAILSVQIYMLFTEEKEKSFIKTTFSSYLNPKLVDILIQNPERIQLGGEDKEVTVLFSAIKNLHDLTGGMGAKDLIGFLNEYFSMMTDIVMETSGTLDKYIGDSVMAFWGAPVDNPGHAFNACNAGLKMLEKVHIFNKGRQEKGLDPIILNIGINTGIIIVGNVGSESQKNYTAIGDSVNLASRLKGLNKFYHTQAVISEFTYDKIKDRVVARELDLTRVKGKLKPVRIYELLDFTE
jgi:adenylate cyclase